MVVDVFQFTQKPSKSSKVSVYYICCEQLFISRPVMRSPVVVIAIHKIIDSILTLKKK